MAEGNRSQEVAVPPARAAVVVVLTVRPGPPDPVRELLSDVAGIVRAVGFRAPGEALSCVTGIGADLWDRLYAIGRPPGLHRFRKISGDRHTAVSTPGDLVFHVRAHRMDLCFELARRLTERLSGLAEVVDEVHGFRYFDERDLLGFVDGTESPTGAEAVETVRVADGDPVFVGGSYLVVQKYVHDLGAWDALPVEEQERAIGRHKLSDIEIPDSEKAPNSHVALNTITDADGHERKIVRENMPFGSVGEGVFGTYFIGYAADPGTIEQMLHNMFVGDPPGNHDRILDFSTALTGTLFFIPPAGLLEDPPPAPEHEGAP